VVSDRLNTENPGISHKGGVVVDSPSPVLSLLAVASPPLDDSDVAGSVVIGVVTGVESVDEGAVVVTVTLLLVVPVVLESVDTGVDVPESPQDIAPSPTAKAVNG
jgi:hypothetical protein